MMNHPESQIYQKIDPEVLALAAKLYAQKTQDYSPETLMQTGAEAQIPPEFVQDAIAQIQQVQIQDRQRQEVYRSKQRQGLLLGLAAVLTGGVLLTGVVLALVLKAVEKPATIVEQPVTKVETQIATAPESGCQTSEPGKDLGGSNWEGKDMRCMNLRNADLGGANLSNANLSGVDLSGADLGGANLANADLSGADLSSADLGGANLDNANLNGANLNGAKLAGANLSRATMPDGTTSK